MADNRKSISELTALPGNLNPDAILAIVQGGVTYHTDFEKLLTFIAGNMSSIESNANGTSLRVPGRLQLCWAYLELPGLAAGETLDYVWEFPEAFPLSSPLPVVIPVPSMTSNFHRSVSPSSASSDWTRESVKLFVRDHRTTGSSAANRLMVAAVARLL